MFICYLYVCRNNDDNNSLDLALGIATESDPDIDIALQLIESGVYVGSKNYCYIDWAIERATKGPIEQRHR